MLAIEFPQGLISINKLLKAGNSYSMNITAELLNPSLEKVESLVQLIKNNILGPLYDNITYEESVNENNANLKVFIYNNDSEYMYKTSCDLQELFNIGLQSFV